MLRRMIHLLHLMISLSIILWSCQRDDKLSPAASPKSPSREVSGGISKESQLKKVSLLTPYDDLIHAELAYTAEDQEEGLSGVKPEDFEHDEGKLFFYLADDERNFWMPDTYFDLDLIYLDEDLRIVEIIWNMPHYPGRINPSEIPRAPEVWSRHVLEMKSGSDVSKKLKVGDQLRLNSPMTLPQIESKIRQLR